MRVILTGAGMNGLATAMLLAKDGHDVTVLERNPASPPSPDTAWDAWERPGVGQFRMLHYLQPRWRQLADLELPEVIAGLVGAGALRYNQLEEIPEATLGGRRPEDVEVTTLTARRPLVEAVLAEAAEDTPGVTVRRGVPVAGFVTGNAVSHGVPHVIGVRTESGEDVLADVVVDVTGRRSPLMRWLDAAGCRPPAEHEEDLGFQYYARHFRSSDGSVPPMMGPLLASHSSMSILTLPADNGKWGVGLVTKGGDRDLRALQDEATWTRVVRSYPLAAHWADGEPIDDVSVMAKLPDRDRRLVVDGKPVVTGALAVGDSWACTNPSLGRGITMGLMHALALRDLLRTDAGDDPWRLALAWDEVTDTTVRPWYEATLSFDRHRLAEISAEIEGLPYQSDDPAFEMTKAMMHASGQDGDVFREFVRVMGMVQSPTEMLAKPGMFDKVVELGAGWRDAPPLPGPDRKQLLEIVHA